MTATLEVTDLRKQFAIGRPAVDGVSFGVPAGEIVVLLGPSGCGKTTTLRCVAGLEHPTDGEISIAGRVVSAPARGIAKANQIAARRNPKNRCWRVKRRREFLTSISGGPFHLRRGLNGCSRQDRHGVFYAE